MLCRSLMACLTMLLATVTLFPVTASSDAPHAAGVRSTPALDLGAFTTVEGIIPALMDRRVVMVGESHTRYDHHLVQLEIIRRLYEGNPRLAIGMEMFQQPFQSHLDDYVAGRISERDMLRLTGYHDRWRMDYRLYAPILRFAREHALPVVALNLPAELTRKVGREGLEALTETERRGLPERIDRSDRQYEARTREVFEFHPGNTAQRFEHFLEVQLLWDEGMAERAAGFLREHDDFRMVILAGSGHLAWRGAIPDRLARRIEVTAAVVLNSWNGEIGEGLADYLLYPEEQVLPATGKIGARLEEDEEAPVISACLENSACRQAGLRKGDRLVAIDGHRLETLADLRLHMWDRLPGDTVQIEVLRRRFLLRPATLSVTLTLQ